MATRNLSVKYAQLRSLSAAQQQAAAAAAGGAGGLGSTATDRGGGGGRDEEAGLPLVPFPDPSSPVGPPAWVALHEAVTKDLNTVREQSQSFTEHDATTQRTPVAPATAANCGAAHHRRLCCLGSFSCVCSCVPLVSRSFLFSLFSFSLSSCLATVACDASARQLRRRCHRRAREGH
jgi:hypothetical protein